MKKIFSVGIFVVLLMALGYGVSWIVTCGIIKLITICFGWEFSWAVATGTWLVIILLKNIFGGKSSSSK